MPKFTIEWEWSEAFDKFGFGDGDGWNGTQLVMDVLMGAGYKVEAEGWGMHNYTIMELISPDGTPIVDYNASPAVPASPVEYGCDDARTWLPAEVVELLDKAFPPDESEGGGEGEGEEDDAAEEDAEREGAVNVGKYTTSE